MTIDDLPNDVLLMIFNFYVVGYQDVNVLDAVFDRRDTIRKIESWQLLVHVCRRWRGLVFESPRRLNLRLFCTPGAFASQSLDVTVWPALPLLIKGDFSDETSMDNVIAELEHSDRICQINLSCYTPLQIEKLWTAMQVPFPELEILCLHLSYAPVLLDSILGGSASSLRYLALYRIPFPRLPKLLMSTTHLVHLYLVGIPHSGYISPDAMVACLSVLTSLETLQFEFESPQSFLDQESRRSTSPTRSVIPALTDFEFKGVNEYLEELVAHIEIPRLCRFSATFFNDIDFDTSELIQFVSQSSILKAPHKARVFFGNGIASVTFQSQSRIVQYFRVKISCRKSSWQLSSLAQICTTGLPLLSTTEDLFIFEPVSPQLYWNWKSSIENIEWMELLLPFTAVKNLYLSRQFALYIAPALQEMTGDGATGLLPDLQNLYLEGFEQSKSVEAGIERFISARQLANCPVAISVWDTRDLFQDKLERFEEEYELEEIFEPDRYVAIFFQKKKHKSTATHADEVHKSLHSHNYTDCKPEPCQILGGCTSRINVPGLTCTSHLPYLFD